MNKIIKLKKKELAKYVLTPPSETLENLTVVHVVKISPPFIESKVSSVS
jgi:hypothetical protein